MGRVVERAALPWLYRNGISTGDMLELIAVLVGEEAKRLSTDRKSSHITRPRRAQCRVVD
jgi:hypothetical protein